MAKWTLERVRVISPAQAEAKQLHSRTDIQMLLAFVTSFEQLGWMPASEKSKGLLKSYDVLAHRSELKGYQYYRWTSKGGRGEREPWLHVFFVISRDRSCLRIVGCFNADLSRTDAQSVQTVISERVDFCCLTEWVDG